MKKTILRFVFSFFVFARSHPAQTLTGASNGLMIWFEKLLPTLLPFLIAVNLLQNADIFTSALRFFPRAGSVMAILAAALPGFLFGLPVGAKLTADFTEKGLLTQKAGNLLLICCNQLSPAFVGSYVMIQCLNSPDLIPVSYLLLYLPPAIPVVILLARTALAKDNPSPAAADRITTKKASRFQTLFQIIDASILNGFETIAKLGGYLIFFGILCQYLENLLPLSQTANGCVMMLMEVTSGIHYFSGSALPFFPKYLLCMTALSFGGLCTHAQTFSVISGAPLSKRRYVVAKTIFALITLLLSFGALTILSR